MRTFETTIRSRSFWLAVVLPPLGYWAVVQVAALRAGDGPMGVMGIVLIVALAQALPMAALGWICCSVAAYTISPGKLVEHRVLRDRQFALDSLAECPRVVDGVVVLRLAQRTLRLQVAEPELCHALLSEAFHQRVGRSVGE